MLAIQYIKQVEQLIEQCKQQVHSIDEGAGLIADAIKQDGVLHVFGCGHSQMYAEEIFYRAGGLVPVNPILESSLSLRPTAPKSTWFERLEGYASLIWEHQETHPGEVVLIASTSGRNAVPVEMALEAKKRGLSVIALTSSLFSLGVKSRHASGKKLLNIADVVLDSKAPKGDAVMELEGLQAKFGPVSSIIGFTLLQALIVETVNKLVQAGLTPPVWVSSNLDEGDAINREYIKAYKKRITCL
ncbi:putative phosphosugar-binding protein [Melghirimyces profundicolus]|uniref:Putative phosphosugar-binding protein n=1 Tax=Melghirimyces profundicolus TaxID=1242148 RepID=A0A2T6BD88_9BACL|nr:SIS domain-containing protein [Melghirimyces profundicolus]PTX53992.1 putative phosphosugar-binding protein [Melghirimyces profundicolus]